MNKLTKIPTLKTGNDSEETAKFLHAFNDAQNAVPRVIAFGVLAWDFKLNRLKHGQFLPWLTSICPDGRKPVNFIRAVQSHLNLTKSVLEEAKIKIRDASRICHGGKILLLPEAEVSTGDRPAREKILSIIDGKSARQLFAEYKQADDDTEKPTPKRGRLKGQGGASKEQRASAAEREEQQRIESVELDTEHIIDLLNKHCDAKGFGAINKPLRKKLATALSMVTSFIRTTEAER